MTDQQYIDTISAGGCPHVDTPALDWLTKRGLTFSQSYCPNPVCSPARSAIFSGRTSSETGVISNGKGIPNEMPNLGQWFSAESDYDTVYAGKWHVPKTYTHFIPGFRVITTGIGGQGNVCDTAASRACEGYIRSRTDSSKPFLMVASFLQPHDICEWLRINTDNVEDLRYPELADKLPELPPNFEWDFDEPEAITERRGRSDPARGGWSKLQWRYYLWSYYRHIEMVDAEIGRIFQALEETGRADETLILFTSDHGEGLAQHQMVRKSFLYETGCKVPLIVSWPGHIPEGHTDPNHVVSGLDIFPTFCDYAGIGTPENMRGRSLRTIMEDSSKDWNPFIVTECSANTGRMVRTDRYKYITYEDDPIEQLFDLIDDPFENKNLATLSKFASVAKDHRKLLNDWEDRLFPHDRVTNAATWRTTG